MAVTTNAAWDRLPEDYRKLCESIARGGLSPRNKRVRAAADEYLARQAKQGG